MSFYPSKNADFVLFAAACAAAITADPSGYGLTSGQAVTLTTQSDDLTAAYNLSTAPETRTPVTVQAFKDQRTVTTSTIEAYNKIAQLVPATPEALTAAGFPVYKTSRSPQTPITAGIGLELISAVEGVTRISARNPETPTSKKKPADTGAIELAIAIGTTVAIDPAQANDTRYYTKTPLDIMTEPSQRGKIMVVWARYQSKGSIGGQKVYGPWSMPLQVNLV